MEHKVLDMTWWTSVETCHESYEKAFLHAGEVVLACMGESSLVEIGKSPWRTEFRIDGDTAIVIWRTYEDAI